MVDPSRQSSTPQPGWLRLCQWLRPKLKFLWTAVVLALVLGIVTTWLTTKHFDIRGTPLEWFPDHWPLVLAGGGLLIVLTAVVSYLGRPVTSSPGVLPTRRDRRELIHRLSNEYRRQQAQSLQEATMRSLEGQETAAVKFSSASLVPWRVNMPGKAALAAPTPIVEAYEQSSVGLLILGDPGVGKSTLLLELALELLARAEKDKERPVPVLVNLSSWALNKPTLTSWLEERLDSMCDIPRQLTNVWIDGGELLLLLDGLDEMELSARTACIASIVAYRDQAKHPVRLVVSSRPAEYLAQGEGLRQLDKVEVLRLMPEQVESYLKRLGTPLTGVLAVLQSNAVLRELVTTPLMLSVVMLAYRGKTSEDLPHPGTEKEQQRQVLEHYVTRMLDPQEKPERQWRYAPDSTRKWLVWLAQQMKKRYLTEFYLEQLQSTWLTTGRSQVVYGLLLRLLGGLVGGLVGGLLAGLVGGLFDLIFDNRLGSGAVLFGLLGMVLGLSVGLFEKRMQPAEVLVWSWDDFWQELLLPLLIGLLIGLLAGLVGGLVNGIIGLFKGLGVLSGLINGLGLGFFLLGGLLGSLLGFVAVLLGRLVGFVAARIGSRRRL
jgi:NACHT domain